MARFQRICIRPPLRPCGFVVPALYVRSRPRWWSAGFDDLLPPGETFAIMPREVRGRFAFLAISDTASSS
jgi:hypothetical protein